MVKRDIIVMGGSAGSIPVLCGLLSAIPRDFQAAILIAVHLGRDSKGFLPRILARGNLPTHTGQEGQQIQAGHVYVAPPDQHLLVEQPGRLKLSRGPKENGFRPALDPLFRSAAIEFGPRVVGVVLSGMLDDGTVGMMAVKRRGGITIVQDPAEAHFSLMPASVLKALKVDHCLPSAEIPERLLLLNRESVPEKGEDPMSKEMEIEYKISREENPMAVGITDWGSPSLFTCPECHGNLMEIKEGPLHRFRCHTGHAFTLTSLLSELIESADRSMWNAIRSMQETELVLQHQAQHMEKIGKKEEAAKLLQQAKEAALRVEQMHQIAMSKKILSGD